MASLNKLFPDPCKCMWNSSMVLNGGRIFPPKQHLAAILDFLLFEFFKFTKMCRRGPKIVFFLDACTGRNCVVDVCTSR